MKVCWSWQWGRGLSHLVQPTPGYFLLSLDNERKRRKEKQKKKKQAGGIGRRGGERGQDIGNGETQKVKEMRVDERKGRGVGRRWEVRRKKVKKKGENRKGKRKQEGKKFWKRLRRDKKLGQREGEEEMERSFGEASQDSNSDIGLRAHSLAPEPRLWTPLQEHCPSIWLSLCRPALPLRSSSQPGGRARIPGEAGGSPPRTNFLFHALQPLWLALTISTALASCWGHEVGSSRHH